MKATTILFGLLAAAVLLAGCVSIEKALFGEPIQFGQPATMRLNETRSLADNSVSISLAKIEWNPPESPNMGAPLFAGTATFNVKDLSTGTEQELSVRISFLSVSGKNKVPIEDKAIPFTSHLMYIFKNDDESLTIIVEKNIEDQPQWLFYSPIQCQQNPWEKWYAEGKVQFFVKPTERQLVTAYYSYDYNIEIKDYREIPAEPGTVTCEACACPRGDTIFVQVNGKDAEKMVQLGWTATGSPPGRGSVELVPTQSGFVNGETVRLELRNNSNQPIYYLPTQFGSCDSTQVFKKTLGTFEQVATGNPLIKILCVKPGNALLLGPGEKTLLDWKRPTVFDQNGSELPITGEYKIAIQYSKSPSPRTGGLQEPTASVESGPFTIEQGFFIEYTVSSGWTRTSEEIRIIENRLYLEESSLGTGSDSGTPTQIRVLILPDQNATQLKEFFLGIGLEAIRQEDLNDCTNVGTVCPTDGPTHEIRLQDEESTNMHGPIKNTLSWYYLLEQPPAIAQALQKFDELRAIFSES